MTKDHPFPIGEGVWVINTCLIEGKIIAHKRFQDGTLYAYEVDEGGANPETRAISSVYSDVENAMKAIQDNIDYWTNKQDQFCKIIEEELKP
jgi:hypothetical protein